MSTNMLPSEDRDPNEGGQSLAEFAFRNSVAYGLVKDWEDMNVHALDTMDSLIATASTAPDLFHESPMYFLNALRVRAAFLVEIIDYERGRRADNPGDTNPIRDADLSPQLETRAQAIREAAEGRATLWLKGINPDDYVADAMAQAS